MSSRAAFLAFEWCFLGVAACGGSVDTGPGGSTGSGGSGASTGTGAGITTGSGGSAATGDCQTDADCSGGTCAPLTPGGYKVCLIIPPESTTCTGNGAPDQCCTSADCNAGKCFPSTSFGYCGGPAMQIYNECMTDFCSSDADCAGGQGPQGMICLPAGAFGHPVRSCFAAYCHTNADCGAKPGGVCAPVADPCCNRPATLACVYPGGCKTNSDCGSGQSCQVNPAKGTGECIPGPIPCPV